MTNKTEIRKDVYPIGTEFVCRKSKRIRKVVDHLTTRNSNNEITKFRYRVETTVMGQKVFDNDVVHTTISMSISK